MNKWLVWGINFKEITTEYDCNSDKEKDNLVMELMTEGYTEIDCLVI